MKNFTLALFVFSAFGLFAQNNQSETLKCLFFDLDIDSADPVLVNQIEKYPAVRFVSTDRVDTVRFDNGYSYTIKTPKVFGMPEYKVLGQANDYLKADSTFLFLGGGAGIRNLSEGNEEPKYYTIETVEVTRYFSEEQGVVFSRICEELSDLFPGSQAFEWNNENRSTYTISLGNGENKADLFEKQLVVEYYEFVEDVNPTYVISLSYEKQIPNEVI